MNIAICDDMMAERERLKGYLYNKSADFTIFEYTSGEALLSDVEHSITFDLLFLDIYMDGMSGIAVAQEIRKISEELPIIFLTTSPEFAVDSYRVQAQDYLLKPYTEEDLLKSLERQMRILAQREEKILFQTAQGASQISISHIAYIEAMARKTNIVQSDGSIIESVITMQNLGEMLQKYSYFVRPHRSYIVNLRHVKQLDKEGFHMVTGATLPIARINMASMKSQYLNQILDI